MTPLIAASFALIAQGATKPQEGPILPKSAPTSIPNGVRDWEGFKYLPRSDRTVPDVFPVAADWSSIKSTPTARALVWRAKVVIFTRVDRVHERGPSLVWPGHHSINPTDLARVQRALAQFRLLVVNLTSGTLDVAFDTSIEAEPQTIQGGDLTAYADHYLRPRINGGTYQSEDNVFRGPYQSVFVVHPVGGEPNALFEVQGTPVSVVGIPDVVGQESDGVLASALAEMWEAQVVQRAEDAGYEPTIASGLPSSAGPEVWRAILSGHDDSTEERVALLTAKPDFHPAVPAPGAVGSRGPDTSVRLSKDPTRGQVLVVDEVGSYRSGGTALPMSAQGPIDTSVSPTFSFWMKSEAKDPIVLRFSSTDGDKSVGIGRDVPFSYDGTWQQVKIDLRPLKRVSRILIAPDTQARVRLKETLGPITASFDDFEVTNDAPDGKPTPEPPSATAATPEARASWAASAGPGEARRALLKDPNEAVRANAAASALARPDPADEPALIETAMYNYDPNVFGPALRALANLKTPSAIEGLQRALRTAASDRARGMAAEALAQSGDPKLVPYFLGLNQSRSRASRISAIRALAQLPGADAAMMRLAFLPQDDPEIKLEATLTADANDDYQGRKLLWSAINEPSDAVRLESLRRLAYSSVAEFAEAGMKGVRDDSVGVRVGLLDAWSAKMSSAFLPAVKIALTDRSPRVRAAALRALAASDDPVASADVAPAFEDSDPRVQLAVLDLASKKKIEVPAGAAERLRKSPDPKVRAAAG